MRERGFGLRPVMIRSDRIYRLDSYMQKKKAVDVGVGGEPRVCVCCDGVSNLYQVAKRVGSNSDDRCVRAERQACAGVEEPWHKSCWDASKGGLRLRCSSKRGRRGMAVCLCLCVSRTSVGCCKYW